MKTANDFLNGVVSKNDLSNILPHSLTHLNGHHAVLIAMKEYARQVAAEVLKEAWERVKEVDFIQNSPDKDIHSQLIRTDIEKFIT